MLFDGCHSVPTLFLQLLWLYKHPKFTQTYIYVYQLLSMSYLHDDVSGYVKRTLPAGESNPHVGEPVSQQEPQSQREDSNWIEQQGLDQTPPVANLLLQ